MKLSNAVIGSALLFLARSSAPAQASLIGNGNFQNLSGAPASFSVCTSNTNVFNDAACQADGWSGTYQIAKSPSGFGVPQPEPQGSSALVIETYYNLATSFATETFDAPAAGKYILTFYAANCINGVEQTLFVLIDNVLAARFGSLPTTWTLETVDFYANAGQNSLTFAGLTSSNGDASSFINGVSLSAAATPEPGFFALFGLGLVGVGLIRSKVKSPVQ